MDGTGSGLSNSDMRLVVLAMLNLRIMLPLFVSQRSICTLKVLETKKFVNKRNDISLLKQCRNVAEFQSIGSMIMTPAQLCHYQLKLYFSLLLLNF
jgi:hypothetical protein